MAIIENFKYRPEVDGLRAIAVIAVVLYHAGLGVPGGFVGVDIFFVISGYLITSLIVKEVERGTFSMVTFWERRARRILPASIVLVVAVLISGWFLLLPSDYAKLGLSAGFHSLFAANLYFWRTTNYFAGPSEEQPLLHTWSLGVEEQFYVFFPLLLAGFFFFRFSRCRLLLLTIFGGIFVTSFVLSEYTVSDYPTYNFYLLPFRAWELVLGSIVALLPLRFLKLPQSWREAFAWCGFLAVLVPCFVYSHDTTFPGLSALPPCLGAAMLIWATGRVNQEAPMVSVGRLLSSRPLVFIGLISYSLYLWHWPFFAYWTYWELEPASLLTRLLLVLAGLVLAVLSWRFIETPFRLKQLGGTKRSIFTYSGVGLVSCLLAAGSLVYFSGVPTRFSDRVNAIDQCRAEALPVNQIASKVNLKAARAGEFPRFCSVETPSDKIIVWGDSHAQAILPAVLDASDNMNAEVYVAWYSATAPVLDYEQTQPFCIGKDAVAYNRAVFDFIESEKIENVLLVAKWAGHFEHSETVRQSRLQSDQPVEFGAALANTVKQLRELGCNVWFLRQVPVHLRAIPKVLIEQELWGIDGDQYRCDDQHYASLQAGLNQWTSRLAGAGAQIIDVSSFFYDSDQGLYRIESQDRALYHDKHHLTQFGASMLSEGILTAISSEKTKIVEVR